MYCFERERERETPVCCSIYLCINWLLLVCALTGAQTRNLGISGWHSNQLSYLASAPFIILKDLVAIIR